MNIIIEEAKTDRSTCVWCRQVIAQRAIRARFAPGYERGAVIMKLRTYCRDCALRLMELELQQVQGHIDRLKKGILDP
jgi:hypothetical protein